MSKKISIKDLNPSPSKFEVAGNVYHMKKFSLAAQVWADTEFSSDEQPSGLYNLSDSMRNLDVAAIAKVAYYLLVDKSEIENYEGVIDLFRNDVSLIKVLLPAVDRSIRGSQPDQTDVTDEEVELKKL